MYCADVTVLAYLAQNSLANSCTFAFIHYSIFKLNNKTKMNGQQKTGKT